jgi:hypothetical protein
MRRLLAIALVATTSFGCSIYKAATAPPPIAVDQVKTGSSRSEVMSVLGTPKASDVVREERTDVYEFIDGFDSAAKFRIVPYIAADFFTIGLAELVLWPMEVALLQGSEGRAVVTYGDDNRAKNVVVLKRDGSPWRKPENEMVSSSKGSP